jgi:hypothetical protein
MMENERRKEFSRSYESYRKVCLAVFHGNKNLTPGKYGK